MINVGDYIIKNNYTTFGNDITSLSVIRIDHIDKHPKAKTKSIVNHTYCIINNKVTIVSEKEAIRIMRLWESCAQLSHPDENENIISKHIREDNGDLKVVYKDYLQFRKPLFTLSMKYPDKLFQTYTCPICGGIHIGKTKNK